MLLPSGNIPNVEEIEDFRQEHVGRLFMRAHRDFSERAVKKLHERGHNGLSLAHTALLSHLDMTGTQITILAHRAGMTKQSMGQLVKDLAAQGYVACTTDPTDRRAIIVNFTAAGHKFLTDAYAIKHELEAVYAAILGQANFRLMVAMLNQLLEQSPELDHSD